MITISGLGADYAMERSGTDSGSGSNMMFYQDVNKLQSGSVESDANMMLYQAIKPGQCVAPDVMSEFGCLTPFVETGVVQVGTTGAGYPIWGECPAGTEAVTDGRDGICRSCPPNSQPYSATHCLRTGNVETERAAALAARIQAEAEALAAAAAKAQADADAVAAAAAIQQASQAEALRQQQYADMVAAAAKQAADAAVAAYAAAHPDGTSPSPGMTVTPTNNVTVPAWSAQDERKRWYKWGAIGAGVVGVGLLAALVARR